MEKVRVRRDELLVKLRENRAGHKTLHEEAVQGYRKQAEKALKEQIENLLRADGIYHVQFGLRQPEQHLADYDRAIAMLDMALDTEIELSENEFAELVMDDWGWKAAFMGSNVMYTSTR